MEKTTIYLPPELRSALKAAARARGSSEADVIREALAAYTAQVCQRPRLPLIESGKPDLAERVEEYLEGFGAR